MGGVDKGLQTFRNRPLVEWAIARLKPQVAEILINANQNQHRYGQFGYQVIPDLLPDYAGPLAGLQSALSSAAHELVLTVPCDSPFLPSDLAKRLQAALSGARADVAVARTGTQPHPVFCLARRALLPNLSHFLQQGGRKIDAWYADLHTIEVAFDDQPDAFANFNTLTELNAAEKNADT